MKVEITKRDADLLQEAILHLIQANNKLIELHKRIEKKLKKKEK